MLCKRDSSFIKRSIAERPALPASIGAKFSSGVQKPVQQQVDF